MFMETYTVFSNLCVTFTLMKTDRDFPSNARKALLEKKKKKKKKKKTRARTAALERIFP